MLCSSDCIWAENAEHLYNDFKSNAERVWKQRINEVIRSSVDATISKQTELSLPNSMVAARKDVTQVAWRFDFPRLIVKNHTSEKIDTSDQDLVFALMRNTFLFWGKRLLQRLGRLKRWNLFRESPRSMACGVF